MDDTVVYNFGQQLMVMWEIPVKAATYFMVNHQQFILTPCAKLGDLPCSCLAAQSGDGVGLAAEVLLVDYGPRVCPWWYNHRPAVQVAVHSLFWGENHRLGGTPWGTEQAQLDSVLSF